jgi:hypothetical protein
MYNIDYMLNPLRPLPGLLLRWIGAGVMGRARIYNNKKIFVISTPE